jgi:tetratricopeptide (TPR) repeat protein
LCGGRYLALGRIEEALEALSMAIGLDPTSFHSYVQRARIHRALDDFEQEVADYTSALETATTDAQRALALKARATATLNLDREQSFADYDESIRLKPNDEDAWYCRGLLWEDEGDAEAALRDFTEVIRLGGGTADAYRIRARLLDAVGNAEEAALDRQRADELEG